jgi:hypothetical protein
MSRAVLITVLILISAVGITLALHSTFAHPPKETVRPRTGVPMAPARLEVSGKTVTSAQNVPLRPSPRSETPGSPGRPPIDEAALRRALADLGGRHANLDRRLLLRTLEGAEKDVRGYHARLSLTEKQVAAMTPLLFEDRLAGDRFARESMRRSDAAERLRSTHFPDLRGRGPYGEMTEVYESLDPELGRIRRANYRRKQEHFRQLRAVLTSEQNRILDELGACRIVD